MAKRLTITQRTAKNKVDFLIALEKTLGIITTAAKKAGVSRIWVYQQMKKDPVFEESVRAIDEVAIDFVETKLYENIQNNKEASTIFYLKTKGKKRGYREGMDLTIETKVTKLEDYTDEDLLKLENELKQRVALSEGGKD